MKKKIILLVLIMLSIFMFNTSVKANSIDSINMDIYVDKSGDAHVTEVWDATLNQGTEGYKPYYNLGKSEIKDFKVSENGKYYNSVDHWNTSSSFSEKAYKNGINTISDGVELCWGISSYTKHSYKLEYTITNFVAATDDSQIIYWTLIPYELSSKPSNVKITIHADEAFEDTLDVWGYGNYGGRAFVHDGIIEMNSDGTLESNEYMTILVKFKSDTFNTSNVVGNNFDYYYKMADKGATHYKKHEPSLFEKIISFIVALFSILMTFLPFIIIMIVTLISSKKNTVKFKPFSKDIPMFRDIPTKDMFKAYFVACNTNMINNETRLFGVMFLKWLKEGNISISKETKDGIFKGKEKTTVVLKPLEETSIEDENEKDLYNMIYDASSDGKLETKEFEKWCRKHYTKIYNWFKKVSEDEKRLLKENKELVTETTKALGIFTVEQSSAGDSLNELAGRIKGLQKFLKEFGRMHEKQAIEVSLWEYYLMYASLFGIADKVAKEFKQLYPEILTNPDYNYDYDTFIILNSFSNHGITAASSARSAASVGNYSSGGGGFSSGGGGGGSFGGGGGGGGFR